MIDEHLIDPREYALARSQLGANFVRILGYFREDGIKSVEAVEAGMRARDAAAMVRPAHTLKGESRQFGSRALGDLTERIEMTARRCVERRAGPEEMLADVAELRICFTRTLTALESQLGPALSQANAVSVPRRTPAVSFGLSRH